MAVGSWKEKVGLLVIYNPILGDRRRSVKRNSYDRDSQEQGREREGGRMAVGDLE